MLITELTGNTQQHLSNWQQKQVHKGVIEALTQLTENAAKAGFQLTIASGFRDFQRQLVIWNNKFSGQRPVYDQNQNIVDLSSLTEWQKVQAIMLYSAIPGLSRHHWGTDFDLYDKSSVSDDYQLQLTSEEYGVNGPFYSFFQWLSEHAATYGFYFPYLNINAGVANEPWHLSYYPVAKNYTQSLMTYKDEITTLIESSDIAGKQAIVKHFDFILEHYLLNLAEVTNK